MATSYSQIILSNLKTKIVARTDLWYGRYDHCLSFFLNEASCLRGLDHDYIDRTLEIRTRWGQKMTRPSPGSWRGAWTPIEITDHTRYALHDLCDRLVGEDRDHKITIFGDWVYLYCSGRSLIDDIAGLEYLNPARMGISRVKLIGEPGTVCVKNPQHAWRSYLRYRVQTAEQAARLRDFFSRQPDLRFSPALKKWIDDDWKNVNNYYFFDHDNRGILTMLALIDPRLIRKTLPIVAAK